MKKIWDLAKFIAPYKYRVVLNVVCNLLMVVFSIFSITLFIPFLNILLSNEEQEKIVLTEPGAFSFFDIDSYTSHFNYFFSQFILEHGQQKGLSLVLGVLLTAYFFRNLFRYLAQFFVIPARNGIIRDLRQILFDRSMDLPLGFFTERRKGDIISRVSNDIEVVQMSILQMVEVVVREPLMIIGSLGIMLFISGKLTVFVIILLLVSTLLIGGIGRALKKQSHKAQSTLGTLMSLLEQGLSGLKVIKAFNAEGFQKKTFFEINNTYKDYMNRLLWRQSLSSPISEFLGVLIFTILFLFGFDLIQNDELEASTFIAFIVAFWNVTEPAKKLSNAYYNIRKGLASLDRINEVIQEENKIQDLPNAKILSSFEKGIQFDNVSFAYPEQESNVLEKVNLAVPKGKVIALVGPSGSGKSTLVDLILRYHDVGSGSIKIDGIDVKDLKLFDLRRLFGLVTQEPILFNDTIYNNITFGYDDATKEEVIQAAKVANAHDFILESEHGYDTNIGDRGSKLSGGQRQRLTIARAILRNPPILILDEATSALDSKSEKLVQDSIQKVMQNRTAIIIAHRLSTIQHADQIVVLKEGRVVEQGSHTQLMSENGDYQKLVKMQLF
jgi:subfamily B ATP-binding cassette protein MsbA